MMFGLGPAPRIFTKLMKIPISMLRKLKIRLIIYMDDMLIMACSLEEISWARDTTLHLLEALGFVINYKKSILTPCQSIEFLGMIVDSITMSLIVPPEKVENLSNLCAKTMRMSRVTLRKMAKVIGKLKSTAPAFSWAPLQTRHLQQVLIEGTRKKLSYEASVPLSRKAILSWS